MRKPEQFDEIWPVMEAVLKRNPNGLSHDDLITPVILELNPAVLAELKRTVN